MANMDKLGTAGVTTISIINCIGVDQAFIDFIEKEPLDIKSDTVPNTIEQAKVIGVYEAAKSTWQVEMKAASERQVNALPPQLQEMDLDQCVKIFNTAEDEELTDDVIPSKAFLERKIGEITSSFKAEPLTRVTNRTQEDTNQGNSLGVEASGFVKMSTEEFALAMPKGSEGLERRLLTLGHCWIFARMKNPAKSQLVSCGIDIFTKYINS